MRQVQLIKLIWLFATFVVVGGCSFAQTNTKFQVSEFNDIDYLEGKSIDTIQKLNLVVPKGIRDFPILVWVGGGAWSYVDRNMEMDLARKFAAEGIAVASIGHRLSAAKWRDSSLRTGVQHPEHMKDLAASIKWLYAHTDDYGIGQDKFFVGGYSSGAHLAALMGLDPTYLEAVGLSLEIIRGMIPISGTYDITNYHKVFKNGDNPALAELHVEAVFGDTSRDFLHASPTSYLDNLGIPMLLISDNALDRYTRFFEKALEKTNFEDYEIIYVPDLNHGQLWRNLSFAESSEYRNSIIQFIENNN